MDPTRTLGDITAPGALVCTSETRTRAGWRSSDHAFFGDGPRATRLSQVRTGSTDVPSRAQLSRDNVDVNPSEPTQNGLWCCRVMSLRDEADVVANFVFVGVYRRGMGECRGEGGRGCEVLSGRMLEKWVMGEITLPPPPPPPTFPLHGSATAWRPVHCAPTGYW